MTRPKKSSVNPTVTANVVATLEGSIHWITVRSTTAPRSGASTNTVSTKARPVLMCQPTDSCQYTKAMNMPMAPWAMLKMPDVEYVTTSPLAATA